jgi:hypothetical protein
MQNSGDSQRSLGEKVACPCRPANDRWVDPAANSKILFGTRSAGSAVHPTSPDFRLLSSGFRGFPETNHCY